MSTDPHEEQGSHPTKEELLTATQRVVQQRGTQGTSSGGGRGPTRSPGMKDVDWSSQGALVLGGVLFGVIVLYVLLGTCRSVDKEPRRPVTDASLLPGTVKYGGVPLAGKSFVGMEATRTIKDADLIAAITPIAEEKGLPGDIFDATVPAKSNVATELTKLFTIYKDNPGELERLRSGVSAGEWKISKETLNQVSETLTRLEPKRQEIRSMLERKDACFAFEFEDTAEGKVPNTEASDYIGDYVLVEEYAIARALDEGQIDAATESLAYIFRIAELAAEVKNPGIRSKAAKTRRHAIDIMQTIVLDSKFQQKNLLDLYEMLKEQWENWSSDANTWIGDRASGLKVYNLIAQYGLEAGLEPNEIAELKERGLFEGYNKQKNLSKILAKDQVYYLQMMKSIIDISARPLYQRRSVLDRVYSETRRLRGTTEEPLIAGFLLQGIPELMNYMALERVEFETAFLAVAFSLNEKSPADTMTVDPLYGKKYEMRRMMNPTEPTIPIVQMTHFGSLKPFRVPDYSKVPAERNSLPTF